MTNQNFFGKLFKSWILNKCCNLSLSGQNEELIKEKAYYLWEAAGKPECDGTQFWLEAEKQLTNTNC